MEADERSLAALGPNTWSLKDCSPLTAWCEQLRVLRWLLGVDGELAPIASSPTNYKEIANLALSVQATKICRVSSELQDVRDLAWAYFIRIAAELQHRSLLSDTSLKSQAREELNDFRAGVLGESEDFLLGAETVAASSSQLLLQIFALSWARYQYVAYLADLLNAESLITMPTWIQRTENN